MHASHAASRLVYDADAVGSGYSKDITIDGFTIRKLSGSAGQHKYDTNFGDPSAPLSVSFAQVRVDLHLERDSLVLFLKLMTALYTAFLISTLALLLLPYLSSMMGTVNGILVGVMFAAVVNLHAVDAVIGRSDFVTLVDRLHFAAFAYFVVLDTVTITVWLTLKRWSEDGLKRFSAVACVVYVLSFVIANVVMIHRAAS